MFYKLKDAATVTNPDHKEVCEAYAGMVGIKMDELMLGEDLCWKVGFETCSCTTLAELFEEVPEEQV